MTNLTRWNPLKRTARFDPMVGFDDLLRSGMRPLWREFEGTPDINLDVSENDKAYTVKADLPGVDKNDIDVSVEGAQVSISAEIKRETRNKDNDRELFTERYYGSTFRSFTLPSEVASDKVEARYENGVLSLTLPKKANGAGRRITVS